MEYIGIIVVTAGIILALIIKSVYNVIEDKRKLTEQLIREWGHMPSDEYYPGKIDSIRKYYLNNVNSKDIDDITWNDLDMDELFIMLNNTQSSMGEEVLYSILRSPLYDADDIEYRNILISYLYNNEADRIMLQRYLKKIGKNKKISFFDYFGRLDNIKKESSIYHILIDVVWAVSAALLFVYPMPALGIIFLNLFVSITTYYRRKLQIDSYYSIFNFILKMLYSAEKLSKLNIVIIKNELDSLSENIRKMSGFRRNSYVVLNPNGGNLIDIVFDYFRMLTHIDLIKFNSMLKIINNNTDVILEIHNIIGILDSMTAVASYRKMKENTGYCIPEFTDKNDVFRVRDIYHPFIERPVLNSYDQAECALITGSNASGKSTFLKAVAINAIMAQTVATVNAGEYKARCYHVMTSMALTDNIFNNRSYFIVEIMSLKRIVDCLEDIPVLCCIDEVLRGTNTIERIAASGQILRYLAASGVLCFAATHDIELALVLRNYFKNYHFREKIINDNIEFNYKMYEGVSDTRNAINLLQILGFDNDIVNAARQSADEFEKNGVWNVIK